MKRNEYEKREVRGDIQFCKNGDEIAWVWNGSRSISWYYGADIRWFNVGRFDLDCVDLKEKGKIIGDE